MATSKTYSARPSYSFLSTEQIPPSARHDSAFELEESDIFGSGRSDPASGFRRAVASSRTSKKAVAAGRRADSVAPSSLPVNVPDWSKILRGEYRDSRRRDSLDDDSDGGDDDAEDGCGEGMRMPPHEFLARTRMASFSVHEGRGRTLKGRDLSRVRNAIWEKTGFED